jgi:DNA-binding protein HU-beta
MKLGCTPGILGVDYESCQRPESQEAEVAKKPTHKSMNKRMLVEAVLKRYTDHLSAEDAVEAVLDVIVRELTRGSGRVTITNFGTLAVVPVASHKAQDIHRGTVITVPPTVRVRFQASPNLQDILTRRKKLPRSGSSIRKAPKGTYTTPES